MGVKKLGNQVVLRRISSNNSVEHEVMKGWAHLFPLHVLELRLTSFGRCTETDIFGRCTDIGMFILALCLIFGFILFCVYSQNL